MFTFRHENFIKYHRRASALSDLIQTQMDTRCQQIEMSARNLNQPPIHVDTNEIQYHVRESRRARHVHLKLTWQGSLEVVVPEGYDHRGIPTVIAEKRSWIKRSQQRIASELKELPSEHFETRPSTIRLRAIDRIYSVSYLHANEAPIRTTESGSALIVTGAVKDAKTCTQGLHRWLRHKAIETLLPGLRNTSEDLDLPYAKSIIRGQKTRWGSCSAKRVISLNYKLLFLPPELVNYLFVHELCHTRYLNHSTSYWKLVARKLPNYARLDAALKDSWRYVPAWAVS